LPPAFFAQMGDVALHFMQIAEVKGRLVHEATTACLECERAPDPKGPLLRLSGPFQRGPQDAS
jgi:hypothetical protein